jgi:predicted metal-binding membrane protein
VLVSAIAVLAGLAWAYTVRLSAGMGSMSVNAMAASVAVPSTQSWTLNDVFFMFVMWTVMMVAMMLPSATPMVLLFARVMRKRERDGRPFVPTGLFVFGYLLVWVGFSAMATLANWGLHVAGLLSSMMGSTTPMIGGVVLLFAGAFQWTPLKDACLSHCRSPLAFLTAHWSDGRGGALMMGLHHGVYCLGCCWLLMALLFVLGIMNLPWIAALTVFVLLEKVLPRGRLVSRFSGIVFAAWGMALLATGVG